MYKFSDGFETDDTETAAQHANATGTRGIWTEVPEPKPVPDPVVKVPLSSMATTKS